MRTRLLIPAALLLIGCGLRRRAAAPEPARGPARDSLFQLDQTRGDSVAARGAVDGVIAMLAPGAVYLRAGVPAMYGREAVRALLAASASSAAPGELPTWEPLGGGVSYDLRGAYTFGIAAHVAPSRAGIRLERYVAYWERERGRPWRIVAYAEVNAASGVQVTLSANQVTPPVTLLPRQAADVVARVRAADSLFSDLADRMGLAYAFSNTVAPDGALFNGSRLVIGPSNVKELYDAQPPGQSLSWRPIYAAVAGSGDLGFTIGEYIATGRGPSGAAVQRFGKYLTVWRRQSDGSWKFVIDGGNATPARAER